jgi:hypothetical protein
MSCTLWATVSDMTNTTSPTRTRLVWKTKDIRRTAASLTAYAVIGTLTAGALYAMVWIMWAGAQAFWGQL